MKKYMIRFLLAVFFISAAGPAAARADEYTFDMDHSGIYFDIKHIFSSVRGNFTDFSGTFVFDPDNLQKSTIEMTVDTRSINTQIAKRDNHLRSSDFFDVSKYPAMTFKSRNITHQSGNNYRVTGDLTIKDVTKTVEVPFVFYGIKNHPMQKNKQVAGFEGRFTIDRLAYHVGDGKFVNMGVLGKQVKIFVALEVLKDK